MRILGLIALLIWATELKPSWIGEGVRYLFATLTRISTTHSSIRLALSAGSAGRRSTTTRRILRKLLLCSVVLLTVLSLVQVGAVSQPDSRRMPLFENLGTLHHAITTTSEQAQQYFDQALRLVMSSTMKRPFMRLTKPPFSTSRY